jgi:cold shock CspA family protein
MNVPVEISFRDVPKAQSIVDLINAKIDKLAVMCDHISSCRVAIERTQKFKREGQPYRVRLDITIPPGHELTVTREESKGDMHTTLPAEIESAFKAAERQIKKLNEKQRRDVKRHPYHETEAVVDRLDKNGEFGFLRTIDNRTIYFHKNSVLHGRFEDLTVGTGVSFCEEQGDDGPQASSVRLVAKHAAI